jgi:hypothetical protein
MGTGTAFYLDSWPDTWTVTGTVSSATTTLIKAGVANQNMYVFYAAWIANGSNLTNTVKLVYGQTVTTPCDTNQVAITPLAVGSGTASVDQALLYGGTQSSATVLSSGIAPATVPFIIPANATPYNLCGVTAGTTNAGIFDALTAIHAN